MLARPRSQRKTCATIFAPIGPGVSYHEPAVAADTYADGGRCVCRTAHTLRADRNAGTLVESVVVSRPVRCLQTRLSTRRPLTSHSHPHPHIQTQHVHVARYGHDDTKRIKTQLTQRWLNKHDSGASSHGRPVASRLAHISDAHGAQSRSSITSGAPRPT